MQGSIEYSSIYHMYNLANFLTSMKKKMFVASQLLTLLKIKICWKTADSSGGLLRMPTKDHVLIK